jgi:hypothetical protein
MAEKRYSKADQIKMAQDFMAKANSRGADFQEIWPTTDQGNLQESVKEMNKDLPCTVAQSQFQTERNSAKAKDLNKPKEPQE